jgi:uncharacterized protein YbjT (DUF2867 family)
MFVIAGVSGHVGGMAARELLAAKQPVKVIVRDAKKGKEWSDRGAEIAVGSLEDAAFLAGALKGAQGFFTLLPPNYTATNFYAAQRTTADAIAQGVKQSGVPHVVILSSIGADLDAGNGPIKGLHYLENKIRETGAKLTALRAAYFQENVGNSVAPARDQGIYPNFTPARDYPMPMIATRDIGVVVAQALRSPAGKSEIVDVMGPLYTTNQVVEKLGKALGKQLQIVDIPKAQHVPAMVQAGLPQQIAEAFAEMYEGFATGKITPKGDRTVQGQTALDDTIQNIVR